MPNLKPLLGPCDSYKLEPLAYIWSWEMSRECEKNTWTPEEIPVAPDVQQWRGGKLLGEEQHLFLAVMAQLTTFDIQRGDDAAETALSIFEPAEVKHFLKRMCWEEALHTRSYRYIIENFGLDLEIYDRWRTVPSMKARVDFGNHVSDSVREIIARRWLSPERKPYTTEEKQIILVAMVYWFLIFEGIWFVMSLAGPVQALSRNGKMAKAAEQFGYILRDECLAEGTEVLTKTGWRKVEDVTMMTEVAQWHPDNTVSWAHPVALTTHQANDYVAFSTQQSGFKQRVSRKHRMPYYTKDGNLKVIAAQDATPKSHTKHRMAAPLRSTYGETGLTPTERFLIALQADGSLPKGCNGSISGGLPAVFGLAKQRKKDAMVALLSDLGWKYTVTTTVSRPKVVCYRVLVPLAITPTKLFSDWVYSQDRSATWCKEFIEEVGRWDGHVVKENPQRVLYPSIEKGNADAVQWAASLAGYRTKYTLGHDDRKESYRDIHRVRINRGMDYIVGSRIKKEIIAKPIRMIGIQVPSSFMVIRDDNCVSITGNTQHIRFGTALINEYVRQYPEAMNSQVKGHIQHLMQKGIDLERDYIRYCIPTGILGYNVQDHVTTAEYYADQRLQDIGIAPIFGSQHKFSWFGETTNLLKEKNFFEKRVTEYQTGGALDWDANE